MTLPGMSQLAIDRQPLPFDLRPGVLGALFTRAAYDGGGQFRIFEQADGVCGERFVVSASDYQPRFFMPHDIRHTTGVRRHDGQPGGETLGDRVGHVVDVGRRQVNVVSVVNGRHAIERNEPGECRVAQFQLARELFEATALPAVAADGEPGLRVAPLDQLERAQHAGHVVKPLVRTAGEKEGAERTAPTEPIFVQRGDVEDRLRAQPEAREDVYQIIRRRDDDVRQPDHRRGHPVPMAQMVFRLAAVIMQDHPLAVELRDQYRRRRREKKRKVRRGVDLNDIVSRQPDYQKNERGYRVDDRPRVFDPLQATQRARQRRVDRQQFGLDLRRFLQPFQQPRRLNRLTSQQVERRGYVTYSDRALFSHYTCVVSNAIRPIGHIGPNGL